MLRASLTQHVIRLLADLNEAGLFSFGLKSCIYIVTLLDQSVCCHHVCDCIVVLYRNYEHIVKAHQNNPQQGDDQVSDQVKFNIFQSIMDSLFQSFSNSVSVNSFQELSACVFSWIEEHCKPQVTRPLHWDSIL